MSDPTFEQSDQQSTDEFGSSATSDYGNGGYGSHTTGDDPFRTDLHSDGYRENPYQANFGDTPYTESFSNVDPQLGATFQSTSQSYDDYSDLEL